jgi:hypothetical protein
MSTLGTSRPTLLDVARALDPDGKLRVAKIAKVLQQYNAFLDDVVWMEGNLSTGNQTTVETSIAAPSLRSLNAGVVPTKSTTGQINDACSILENRHHIDTNVASLNGNTESFRMLQDEKMIRGFSDSLAEHFIYGNAADDPKEFNGLATRYFTLGTTWTTSAQIIDAGGTGSDNTSIWLVGHGEGRVTGIYPKGSKAGLQYEDRGIQDILINTSTGSYMRAYVSWMQWLCGLAVHDYRYVVRIANIDVSNLNTASDSSDTSANIMKYMSKALDLLPDDGSVTPVFYMSRNTKSILRVKQQDKSNLHLTMEQLIAPAGISRRPELNFYGIPCRRHDAILETESAISVHSR